MTYTVRPGDTLSKIAMRNGVTLAQLLNANPQVKALQDVVWSTAVQHGGATPIVHRACARVNRTPADPKYDEELIRAIYAERGKTKPDGNLAYFSRSSASVQKGVANRFKNELQDALAILVKDA